MPLFSCRLGDAAGLSWERASSETFEQVLEIFSDLLVYIGL